MGGVTTAFFHGELQTTFIQGRRKCGNTLRLHYQFNIQCQRKINPGEAVYLNGQEAREVSEAKEMASLKEQVKTLFIAMGELKSDVKEIKEQLANRLPLWATALIASLTAYCGWSAGH